MLLLVVLAMRRVMACGAVACSTCCAPFMQALHSCHGEHVGLPQYYHMSFQDAPAMVDVNAQSTPNQDIG
jgi:hypothetical protein